MLKWIERILVFTALLGLLLECMAYFFIGSFLIRISLDLLMFFYLLFSVFIFNKIKFLDFKLIDKELVSNPHILVSFGIGFILFLSVVTILFRHFLWPGTDIFEFITFCLILIALVFSLIKYFVNQDVFYFRVIKYLSIYGFIIVFMYNLPQFFWVEIKYRNHPDYIEAYEARMTHDRDSILDKKAEIEYEKMVLKESKKKLY